MPQHFENHIFTGNEDTINFGFHATKVTIEASGVNDVYASFDSSLSASDGLTIDRPNTETFDVDTSIMYIQGTAGQSAIILAIGYNMYEWDTKQGLPPRLSRF